MDKSTRLAFFSLIAVYGFRAPMTSHTFYGGSGNGKNIATYDDSPSLVQARKYGAQQAFARLLFASNWWGTSYRSSPAEMAVRLKGAEEPISLAPVDITSSSSSGASDWSGDLLVFPCSQVDVREDLEADERLSALDSVISSSLIDMITTANFTGKAGTSSIIMLPRSSPVSFLAVVGIGKADSLKPADARKLGAALSETAKKHKAKKMGVVWPSNVTIAENLQQTMLEHVLLELSPDQRFKSDPGDDAKQFLEQVEFLGSQISPEAISRARKLVAGVLLTRSLVNAPANYVTPTSLASAASALAKEFPTMSLKVLEQSDIEKLGMGAYLGVSQGAIEPPKFIHLTYSPESGNAKKKIALIGKGLTFDSGGYNIKAGAGSMIEKMKIDMGGAGAVLGAARAIAELGPPGVEVHFIIAACENMVSAEAMRPGDILTASNGKTIEVLNTDAEGRLTLADALVYADRLKDVDVICDVATLTGAIIVALGPQYGAVYSDDDDLLKKLQSSASSQGELLWHMPLASEYSDQLKSPIADLKNLGAPGGGGSITAALFLKEFVKGEGSPNAMWAHVDMAGPVFNDKEGATGYGVRTLTGLVESMSAETEDS